MRVAWVLGAMLVCAGCEATATEIVVVVDSDLRPGTELAAVSVRTGGDSHTFPIDDATDLPLTFGVIPGPRQPEDGELRLTVEAVDPGGNSFLEASAITTFRPNARLVLPVGLARSCVVFEECADEGGDETCRDGECVSAHVDSSTLQRGNGSGVRLFDGPSEGDAGPPLMDAGPPCEPGARCEANAGCAVGTLACTPTVECTELVPEPAGTPCDETGRECDGMGRCGR